MISKEIEKPLHCLTKGTSSHVVHPNSPYGPPLVMSANRLPRSEGKLNATSNPRWWSEECDAAVQEIKSALTEEERAATCRRMKAGTRKAKRECAHLQN